MPGSIGTVKKGHPGRHYFRRQLDVLFTPIRGRSFWRKDENESTAKFALDSTGQFFLSMADRGKCRAICGANRRCPKPDQDTVLKGIRHQAKLFPESVFFRGQTAPCTNGAIPGGVHFSDDPLRTRGELVDNSGYSTGIREKYQAYLISEVTLQARQRKTLKARSVRRGIYRRRKICGAGFGGQRTVSGRLRKKRTLR